MAARPLLLAATAAVLCLPAAALAQTPPPAKGTAISSDRTTVRLRDAPGGKAVAKVRHGRRLRITCQAPGPVASGPMGRTAIWDRVILGSRRLYVADSFLKTTDTGQLVAKLCGAPALDPAPPPGATSGACPITAPVTQVPPYPSRAAFVAAAVPGAQQSQKETKVPTSVTLAQAILESASGTVAAGANNYFGIKANAVDATPGTYDWGPIAVGCVLRKTQEVMGGRSVTTIGAFRAYDSLAASIRDHGARLIANPVYRSAFAYTDDPEHFARVIARSYATDPSYGDKLVALMRAEKLARYDVGTTTGDPTTGGAGPA